VGLRFNPPPNWPPPPPGFVPPPRWQPDPSWPPPPPGWQVWVDDPLPGEPDEFANGEDHYTAGPSGFAGGPGEFAGGPRTYAGRHGDIAGRPGDFASRPSDFAGRHGDFASRPGNFAAGHGEFADAEGDLADVDDDFADGEDDFAGGAPSFGGPTALDYLDGSYTPRAEPGPPSGQPNGFAIAAFVLGAIGGTILSAILGIIALRQIRDTRQRGRGLAIAGLVFSAFWAVVLLGFLFLYNPGSPANPPASAGSSSSSSSPGGSSPPAGQGGGSGGSGGSHSGVNHPQAAGVFALSPDECFQNPPANQTVLGITSVTAVPCTTPHNAQVFAEFAATGTSYPGTAAIKRQADKGCHARLAGRVVNSRITSTMTLRFLYPLASSWTGGHRTISCLIVDAKPDLKSSLLRAS
jgi:hypothetical protein